MRTRLISAAVLVPIVLVLFWLGPPWLTLGMCLLGALAAYECVQLVRAAGLGASTPIAVGATPLVILAFAWAADNTEFPRAFAVVPVVLGLALIAAAIPAIRVGDAALGFRTWLGTSVATLYPSLLGFAAMLVGVSQHEQTMRIYAFGLDLDANRFGVLVLIATVWSLDSSAYVVGKYLPRGHFFNHISPKKTWSGAIGGTVGAMVVCGALFAITQDSLESAVRAGVAAAPLGLVIAVAAQLGDLTESMLKRAAGTKDSGTLIPGHGGFLDRVDSFLFAAPAFYAALVFVSYLNWQPYP